MDSPLIFTVRLDINPKTAAISNDWFNNKHLWDLLSAGFLSGARFKSLQGTPEYMHIYELPNSSILSSPEFSDIIGKDPQEPIMMRNFSNLSSALYKQTITSQVLPTDYSVPRPAGNPLRGITSTYLITIRMDVNPESDEDFQQWHENEHIPLMLKTKGFISARLCKQVDNQTDYPNNEPQWMSIWEISSLESVKDPQVDLANNTSWAQRMHAANTYVKVNVFERIYP